MLSMERREKFDSALGKVSSYTEQQRAERHRGVHVPSGILAHDLNIQAAGRRYSIP